MKKHVLIFLILSVLAMVFVLSSCGGNKVDSTPKVTDPATNPATDHVTDSATSPATDPVTNTVTDPVTDPATDPVTDPPVPTFTVTYRVDGQDLATVNVELGGTATYPNETPVKEGFSNFAWIDGDRVIIENTVITGLFSKSASDLILDALDVDLLYYGGTYNDNHDGNAYTAGAALAYLVMEEHDAPQSGIVRDRILAHLRNLISGGKEPTFDIEPFWNYVFVSASIAMAKQTPSVWNEFSQAEVDRLDLIMKCYAYISAFATDDDNNYTTGPRMRGNYNKNWNPNYRLSNVLPMLFCLSYFGSANAVNNLLGNFDANATYDLFVEYGFTRAAMSWSTPGFALDGGGTAPSAIELLQEGGTAYIKDPSPNASAVKGDAAGSGLGVPAGGTYTYAGYGLENPEKIIQNLLTYNYSGGIVFSNSKDKLGSYILDNTVSPVEGYTGLLKEFNSSGRSSAIYCSHDFLMAIVSAEAAQRLGLYDISNDPEIYARYWVGNVDLCYKLRHGFNSIPGNSATTFNTREEGVQLWVRYWEISDGANTEYLTKLAKPTASGTMFYYSGDGSADLTKTYTKSADVAGNKNWQENCFNIEFTIRFDEKFSGFNLRLRSGSLRTDLIYFKADGTIQPNPTCKNGPLFSPVGEAPESVQMVGEGWHRLGFKYYQRAEADETNKVPVYHFFFDIWLDGVFVGTYEGNADTFMNQYQWHLFTCTYDENVEGHLVYTQRTSGQPYWQIYRAGMGSDKNSVFFEMKDQYGSCSNDFLTHVYAPVTYTLNGGSFEKTDVVDAPSAVSPWLKQYNLSPVEYFVDDSGEQVPVTPVREGYMFAGWYDNAEFEGDPITVLTAKDGQTLNLFAKWEIQ